MLAGGGGKRQVKRWGGRWVWAGHLQDEKELGGGGESCFLLADEGGHVAGCDVSVLLAKFVSSG